MPLIRQRIIIVKLLSSRLNSVIQSSTERAQHGSNDCSASTKHDPQVGHMIEFYLEGPAGMMEFGDLPGRACISIMHISTLNVRMHKFTVAQLSYLARAPITCIVCMCM